MDTPARLLRLLVLFSTRPSWRAEELTERLEVTPRTLRRDVTRLRDLGYPVESTTGRYGGYSLGSGGRLPPLLFDDDEAVAMWSALRHVSDQRRPDARRGSRVGTGEARRGAAERLA
ncbi:MAG: HTH domain-containing protein [Ilumatobacteraceae bacterium]